MSVHYKFKSALDFDTITFDGLHISVGDLKKAIMQQKRLGKTAEFDLQITNAQTKEGKAYITRITEIHFNYDPFNSTHNFLLFPPQNMQKRRL